MFILDLGTLNCEMPPARLNFLPPSDCLLKASNSGFWSTGIMRGEAAAVDLTSEVGGLQFARAWCAALEEKTSAEESMERPK